MNSAVTSPSQLPSGTPVPTEADIADYLRTLKERANQPQKGEYTARQLATRLDLCPSYVRKLINKQIEAGVDIQIRKVSISVYYRMDAELVKNLLQMVEMGASLPSCTTLAGR